jgi:septation ring formation regulator EzrA
MTPEERATELERLRTEYYLTDEDLAQYRAKIEDALDEAKERSEPLRDHMKVVATNRLELLKLSLEEFRIGYSQSRDDERAHLEKVWLRCCFKCIVKPLFSCCFPLSRLVT